MKAPRRVHVYPLDDYGPQHVTGGPRCWCEPDERPDGVVVHRMVQ